MRLCLILLAALACCLGPCGASQYDPHPTEGAQSWFEGWFMRLMSEPADNGQPTPPASITLIVGAMPHAQPGWNASLVMLAVQSASPSEPAPAVFSRTNLHLDFLGAGAQPVTVEPSFTAPPNFTLVAPDDLSLVWNMAGDGCNIFARFGNLSLSAACNGPPLLWSADGYGPEGVLARWPAAWTGLHWFVHSLATPMRWRLESGGGAPALEGRALAHFEKNWGQRFPSAWHWAQGVNASWLTSAAAAESEAAGAAGAAEGGKKRRPRVQAAFTLAGGPPPSPLVPEGWVPNVWLLGVRTPTHSWDFRPFDTVFTAQAAPCHEPEATLVLTATQPLARRAVEVRARRAGFSPVGCPTSTGFRPVSAESFTAYATVRLFELRFGWHEQGWVQKQLLEAWEFEGAALEFGDAARCTEPAARGAAARAEEAAEPAVQIA